MYVILTIFYERIGTTLGQCTLEFFRIIVTYWITNVALDNISWCYAMKRSASVDHGSVTLPFKSSFDLC